MNAALPRIMPFALYMAFVGLEQILRFLQEKGLAILPPTTFLLIYPIKIFFTAGALYLFWKEYDEIHPRELSKPAHLAITALIGIIVFFLWINMDWTFGTQGTPPGYEPRVVSEGLPRILVIFTRLMGAAIIVPIMEELFWRSFLIRYLINEDFRLVSIGTFTWPSFMITTVLFGLEHHFILAGIMAGTLYSILLYRTRSLVCCILAHAITNLALGLYVLNTSRWYFW